MLIKHIVTQFTPILLIVMRYIVILLTQMFPIAIPTTLTHHIVIPILTHPIVIPHTQTATQTLLM